MYLAWAGFYEGSSDRAYFDVLIPKIIEKIIIEDGVRPITVAAAPAILIGEKGRAVDMVASEVCEKKDAFHLLFIHADTGGQAQFETIATRREAYAEASHALCGWRTDRCVYVSPRHELEAWILSDITALCQAFGMKKLPVGTNAPPTAAAAEGFVDPKAELEAIARHILSRRYRGLESQIFTSVAQYQSIESLREAASFRLFEDSLRSALRSLGCLPQ